jgi:DNA-directed RNA polymerase specialized sigma subunit
VDEREHIDDRARRARQIRDETERRTALITDLRETLERDPTPEELAAAAAELHAAHAVHEAEQGHTDRAEAARERERRARERAEG